MEMKMMSICFIDEPYYFQGCIEILFEYFVNQFYIKIIMRHPKILVQLDIVAEKYFRYCGS